MKNVWDFTNEIKSITLLKINIFFQRINTFYFICIPSGE